jgi:DeoR/GlpR family transcriptional regulator of sugar metabolism
MNTEDRLALILERLTSTGRVEVAELRAALGVSEMTVRRDLMRLEDDGALRRVRGGATRAPGGSYEPPFLVRARQRTAEKDEIGRVVASEILSGDTVLLDGGTTGLAVAHHLLDTVVTVCPLSLRVAGLLVNSPTIRLLLPGGFVRPGEQSLIGAEVIESLKQHVFDVFVMTASGMSVRTGFTEWNSDDAMAKRAGLASARRCIVACDSSKFGESAFARVADLDQVDLIVTDAGLPEVARNEMEAAGATVRVAEAPRPELNSLRYPI